METLDLKQAADFLKMHWQTLREKAKAGEVPGSVNGLWGVTGTLLATPEKQALGGRK